ncbi:MAG TPA: DUF1223 domain-containing protein [Acetobacteraceae bacterium]
MRVTPMLAFMLACNLAAAARADVPAPTVPRPIVVELFTSEGCSSCPPADAMLSELAQTRKDVLPLGFHVTYWNGLGWRDPYSLDAATERQQRYIGLSDMGGVYTPQMVIEGAHDVVGSDRPEVQRILQQAAATLRDAAPVTLGHDGTGITISVGAGKGTGTVWLIGYDPSERTAVGRGENAGRTLVESNVVRSLTPVAEWRGDALALHHAPPAGMRVAVIVQAPDGSILGAGVPPQS